MYLIVQVQLLDVLGLHVSDGHDPRWVVEHGVQLEVRCEEGKLAGEPALGDRREHARRREDRVESLRLPLGTESALQRLQFDQEGCQLSGGTLKGRGHNQRHTWLPQMRQNVDQVTLDRVGHPRLLKRPHTLLNGFLSLQSLLNVVL